MFKIEGMCDWCKKTSMLTKHNYVDGKSHHSCQECHDLATLDVRQFNLAELQHRERQISASR